MMSIGAEFLRPDALHGVNHMRDVFIFTYVYICQLKLCVDGRGYVYGSYAVLDGVIGHTYVKFLFGQNKANSH